MTNDFNGQRILILGAGVTGVAAARALRKRGAIVELADDRLSEIPDFKVATPDKFQVSQWNYLLVSPGWKADHPLLQQASKASIPVLNEIDLAWKFRCEEHPAQKWLALTGTNGKTTTVEMAASMIRSAGFNAIACGNVGDTVIDCVDAAIAYDFLILELSSFQLHWLHDAQFHAVAILNIADDHIDWHGSFDAYAQAKISILERTDMAILNAQDQEVVSRISHWLGRKVFYSLDTPAPGEMGLVESLLIDRAFVSDPQEAALIAELADINPPVPHNVSNALAAAGLALSIGASHESIRKALVSFELGRHRIEKIYEADGISWIDDSKATNPHAAQASLMSALSVVWIAGGLAKGAKMAPLIARTKGRIKAAILIGHDRELISAQIREQAPGIKIILIDEPDGYGIDSSDNFLMERVVEACKALAISGDTVLLAPACASMDQFVSYADRGDRFKAAVEKIVAHGN